MSDSDDFYSMSDLVDYHHEDHFLPFDDDAPQLPGDANANDSSDIRSTAAAELVGVALYPVVTWFAVLLTLLSVGLVGNVMVVVAVAVDGDTGRRRRSSTAVVTNLGAALAAACVVVGPLEFAVVAENYVKRSVSSFVCRAAAALYHLIAGTVVSSLVLYSLTRRRRLRRASDCRRSSSRSRRSATGDSAAAAPGTCSASCRRQLAAAGGVDVLPSCRYDGAIVRRWRASVA